MGQEMAVCSIRCFIASSCHIHFESFSTPLLQKIHLDFLDFTAVKHFIHPTDTFILMYIHIWKASNLSLWLITFIYITFILLIKLDFYRDHFFDLYISYSLYKPFQANMDSLSFFCNIETTALEETCVMYAALSDIFIYEVCMFSVVVIYFFMNSQLNKMTMKYRH